MAALIVLASSDPKRLRRVETLLSEAGYLVAAQSSFGAARELLRSVHPDVLIADVRLGAYNGLHLAAYGRSLYPYLQVIITDRHHDPVLEREAQHLGATFLSGPFSDEDLLAEIAAMVNRLTATAAPIRQWRRKRASAEVRVQLGAIPARVFDLSYGGLRLALGDERTVPEEFDITMPGAGITVHAQRVWISESDGEFWCGAEVIQPEAPASTAWREFVDSVN